MYSAIADSLHIPLAHILCWEVQPQFINELISGGLTLNVLTGVAALGRTADVDKLVSVAQILSVVLPVFSQTARVDPQRVLESVFLGVGLNPTDYFFTEEELQAQQDANQPVQNPVDASLSQVSDSINQGV